MGNENIKILIVDDEIPICKSLSASLMDEHFKVQVANNGVDGIKKVRDWNPDIVLLDIWMPGAKDGLAVLQELKTQELHTEFIMMSGHGTIETAVKATKLGAWDFVEKPLSLDKILILISNIINFQLQKKEKLSLLKTIRKSFSIVGQSPSIRELRQVVGRIAKESDWVFLEGGRGVGKTLVAKNIHYFSDRASHSFVKVNCRNFPIGLLEFELFGYEQGAFQGANGRKKGALELANRGTLYLQEVSHLDIESQKKILDFLQNGSIKRIGGEKSIELNVRIISSSSSLMDDKVNDGLFDPKLYSRLKSSLITIQPLRNYVEDIVLLIDYFSQHFASESGQKEKFFSDKAIQFLENYSWPGNVRELRNFMERIYILVQGDYVELSGLKAVGIPVDSTTYIEDGSSFREARAYFEKEFLLKKIAENNGNISKTAESIGLERSYLHRKIKSFGIE